MFPPFVPIKKYSEREIEEFLVGVDEENPENLFIDGYLNVIDKYGFKYQHYYGKFKYDSLRWRVLMSRADSIVVWTYDQSDGEIMFIDYYAPPGSRWRLYNRKKWERR